MKLFNNKYDQAQIWKTALQAREDKKQNFEIVLVPQKQYFENTIQYTHHPEVIFTEVDRGHNQEEASKIQRLYEDLKNIQLTAPLLNI